MIKKLKIETLARNYMPRFLTGALLTFLSSSCGSGNGSGNPILPTFTVETPCTTACLGTDSAVAISDPTGSGTNADPLTASLCSQAISSYDPLVVNVADATSLNCTSTTVEVDVQINGVDSLEIRANDPGVPENFSCEASNADGSATFYFSIEDNETCGGGCFTPETKVLMADGSFKEIINIEIGDKVQGADNAINTVTEIETPVLDLGVLYSLNGSGPFVTGSHPFLTLEGWKAVDVASALQESPELKISQLSPNDVLVLDQGKTLFLETITKSISAKNLKVYNILTNGNETYLVAIQDRFTVVHT